MTLNLIEAVLLVGTSIAAAAVAVVCMLGFIVWLGGSELRSRSK